VISIFSKKKSAQFTLKWDAAVSRGIWQTGAQRNFAQFVAENSGALPPYR